MIRKLEKDIACFSDDEPKVYSSSHEEIIILQTMLIGDNRALIEYVNKKDFEPEEITEVTQEIYIIAYNRPGYDTEFDVCTSSHEVRNKIIDFGNSVIKEVRPIESYLLFTDERNARYLYEWDDRLKREFGSEVSFVFDNHFRLRTEKGIYKIECVAKQNITINLKEVKSNG